MKLNKILAVLIALLLVTAMVPAAFAADTDSVTGTAGEKVTVEFDVNDVYGVNGSLSTSGGNASYGADTDMDGDVQGNQVYIYDNESGNVKVNAEVEIPADAQPGDTIDVTFTYEVSDEYGNMTSYEVTKTIVVGETTPSETPTETTPSETPTTPSKPGTGGNTGKDDEEEVKVDYTELNKQIAIAESLKETDYTAESWATLQEKLEAAYAARESDSQDVVDKAAKELADAIAALVKTDASELEKAIGEGNALAARDELGNLWFQLFEAIQEGIDLIGSGDQNAIDAAVAKIRGLIEQIEAAIEAQNQVTVNEVIVEVEPDGDYCNLAMHRVWPILFFVSLAVNVVLGVVLIMFLKKRKATLTDDTPLVDYDIGDDN